MFKDVENPDIREAYEKIFPRFMKAATFEEKAKYWKLLQRLGNWETKQIEELKQKTIENYYNSELSKS